jgi:hypothetical protein
MKIFSIFLFISLITACVATDNSDSAQSSVARNDLKGSWITPCIIDVSDNDSTQVVENYSDTGVHLLSTFYTDSDCTVKDVSIKFTASISQAGEIILSSGQAAQKVTTTINTDNVLMLMHREGAKIIAISENICSRTDWDNGEYINISNCDTFSNYINKLKGQRKDIYHIDGNKAFWGNKKVPLDENDYPSELNTVPNTKTEISD